MNHDIGDVGQLYTLQKLKTNYQNFREAGSAITIHNDRSS